MKFTDKCSILAGVAGLADTALITVMNDGLAEERQQHAIPLLYREGFWGLAGEEKVLPWLTAGIASTDRRSVEFVIVGWAGQALVIQDQTSHREAIQRKDDYVSIVRSLATIDDAVYAVGMRRQVYKRIGRDRWEEIDHGVAYHGDEPAIGFNASAGFDDREIYAVGLNGEIWRWEDDQWRAIHSPTSVHLHSICCAPDGQVYVGGRSGLLLRGRRDSWELLDTETEETIWNLHWFDGQLYAIVGQGIYRGVTGDLQKIPNDLVADGDFGSLSSTGGALWAFGRKKIVRYDGSAWNEVDCVLPDNIGDTEIVRFFNDDVLVSGSDYLEDEE